MKKNVLILIIILIFLALFVGGIFLLRSKARNEATQPEETQNQVALETPLEDRPFVTLTPRTDGREFRMEISRIKNAQTIEYELVYFAGDLSRGVIGSIELEEGENEVSRDLLLGSCSKDVCKYDEDVQKGSLTLRFRSSEGTRKFTTDFHLQQGEKILTSQDEKFKIEGKFSTTTFYLTMGTIGLPEKTEGKVLSGPYGIFTAGSSSAKGSALTMVLPEGTSQAKLFFFDGQNSTEQNGTEIENNSLTANVNTLGAYFVTE
ncbi:hypothetical protein FJZ41_01000 [Candidatus Shapirobacteria bacterium]|nr:hypothetical protein [Candidatus Shapirobacteria bacterium]